jgi:hypothetical protein
MKRKEGMQQKLKKKGHQTWSGYTFHVSTGMAGSDKEEPAISATAGMDKVLALHTMPSASKAATKQKTLGQNSDGETTKKLKTNGSLSSSTMTSTSDSSNMRLMGDT